MGMADALDFADEEEDDDGNEDDEEDEYESVDGVEIGMEMLGDLEMGIEMLVSSWQSVGCVDVEMGMMVAMLLLMGILLVTAEVMGIDFFSETVVAGLPVGACWALSAACGAVVIEMGMLVMVGLAAEVAVGVDAELGAEDREGAGADELFSVQTGIDTKEIGSNSKRKGLFSVL